MKILKGRKHFDFLIIDSSHIYLFVCSSLSDFRHRYVSNVKTYWVDHAWQVIESCFYHCKSLHNFERIVLVQDYFRLVIDVCTCFHFSWCKLFEDHPFNLVYKLFSYIRRNFYRINYLLRSLRILKLEVYNEM